MLTRKTTSLLIKTGWTSPAFLTLLWFQVNFVFLPPLSKEGPHYGKFFSGGSVVKDPPARKEMCIRSLDQEDPLEKEMATNSSILAWEIPWTEEPGRLYSSWGRKRSDTA